MPRVAVPLVFHPTLQFRYMLFTTKLPTAVIHARSAQQPSFDNSPVTIDHKNGYFRVKGKTKWNDITLSCYQFEGITSKELWRYLNKDHQRVSSATDYFAHDYKHMMQLIMLNPMGIPINIWQLHGAFISSASWGSLDWASDEVAQCDITISYDYAELDGLGEILDGVADTIQGLI